jgi:hypothetical protein
MNLAGGSRTLTLETGQQQRRFLTALTLERLEPAQRPASVGPKSAINAAIGVPTRCRREPQVPTVLARLEAWIRSFEAKEGG